MRVVLDANVIVSAYLGGTLESILEAFKEERFQLIVSKAITDEYLDVLERPKFGIEREELEDFTALLVSLAEFVTPKEIVRIVETDPSDNKFLEAAVAGSAVFMVSGDSHLLRIKNFREIAIISAREFIELLK